MYFTKDFNVRGPEDHFIFSEGVNCATLDSLSDLIINNLEVASTVSMKLIQSCGLGFLPPICHYLGCLFTDII